MPKDRVGDRRGIIYHHQCCVVVAISHISVAMRENCHLYCSSHGVGGAILTLLKTVAN